MLQPAECKTTHISCSAQDAISRASAEADQMKARWAHEIKAGRSRGNSAAVKRYRRLPSEARRLAGAQQAVLVRIRQHACAYPYCNSEPGKRRQFLYQVPRLLFPGVLQCAAGAARREPDRGVGRYGAPRRHPRRCERIVKTQDRLCSRSIRLLRPARRQACQHLRIWGSLATVSHSPESRRTECWRPPSTSVADGAIVARANTRLISVSM